MVHGSGSHALERVDANRIDGKFPFLCREGGSEVVVEGDSLYADGLNE